jgi:hypothetical protein
MERRPDKPKPTNKPFGFYQWASQSSPLFDWIFNSCIGLKDGQNTTYDPINAEWVFDSPKEFRVGLIQGIAESDGSVNLSAQEVEFWVLPDWEFMIKLLSTFGLHAFRNREAVSLAKSQAIESFKVPVFAPHLRTARYRKLELMATTPKLERTDRIPLEIRATILRLAKEGYSVPKIIEVVATDHNLLLSFEAAQRWARKSDSGKTAVSLSQLDENI